MPWRTTTDPGEFIAAAGGFLRSRPAQNTVPLTVAEGLRAQGGGDGATLLGWWADADAGPATGAFLLNPPYPLYLTDMPHAAPAALAEVLAEAGRPVPGVNGETAAADAFAAAWSARTGATATRHRGLRLHRLGALVPPDPMPAGRAITATEEHRALAVAWYEAFAREVGEPAVGVERHVDDRLGHGGLLLWERDGEVVSLAGMTRQVAGAMRVAPVYTPPEWRGHGYAAAATAAAVRAALDGGAEEVLLYTDLADQTANNLYARLGFGPVEDLVVLRFSG